MEAIAERFASSGRLAVAQRGEEHQPHNARSCLSPFGWPNHPLGEPPTLLLALGVEVSHAGPSSTARWTKQCCACSLSTAAKSRRLRQSLRPLAVAAVRGSLRTGTSERKALKKALRGMRRNTPGQGNRRVNPMHWLQHCTLQGARAWHMVLALHEVEGKWFPRQRLGQADKDLKV